MSDAPFGLLVVDKPAGTTSHDVVDEVRRLARVKKVGHTGTLDPAATGVLVLMIGAATRLSEYLKADDKRYVGVVRFGAATTTYDAEGETTAEGVVTFDRAALEAALARFEGEIEQRPPAWSALRTDGERAYERARRGEAVELAPRAVTIFSIRLREWAPPDATIELHCSSGTYVRAVAHDLGEALGCPAHLRALRRTSCGALTLDGAVDLETLRGEARGGRWRARLLPITDALPAWPRVVLAPDDLRRLVMGQRVDGASPLPAEAARVAVCMADDRFAAVASFDAGTRTLRPVKVFVRPEECGP